MHASGLIAALAHAKLLVHSGIPSLYLLCTEPLPVQWERASGSVPVHSGSVPVQMDIHKHADGMSQIVHCKVYTADDVQQIPNIKGSDNSHMLMGHSANQKTHGN